MTAYVPVPENVSAPYYDPGPDVSNGTAAIQQAVDRLDDAKKQMMEPAEK